MNGLLKIAKKLHAGHHDYVDEAFNAAVSGGEHIVNHRKTKDHRKKSRKGNRA